MKLARWTVRHPDFHPDHVGFLVNWLDEDDPRDAKTQLDAGYGYGGHWHRTHHELAENDDLLYPGDPPLPVLAEARLRDERILVYSAGIVVVVQPDGSFQTQRMD